MKVLWFEISIPSRYEQNLNPTMGWQDALQDLIMYNYDIELGIAFENVGFSEDKYIDGVKYFPINTTYNWWERQCQKAGWNTTIEKTISKAVEIIEKFRPDIIHVFGSEWCFGLIAEYTEIPVVIHMQGSIPSYNNALLPPLYSIHDIVVGIGLNPKRQFNAWLGRKKDKSRQAMEERILRKVKYYMGRTNWDKNITQFYNPNSSYYYCSEALRKEFLQTAIPWTPPQNKKFRIVTTGVSSFWKGIDTILRTAHKLKEYGLEFEWILAGKINSQIKSVVERKEKMKYKDNDITIAGFLNPSQLKDLLMSANLYVHTAYIDNSPNAICEAQYLGMPIVATYVGGIPSLIDNNKEGILIPANDPFTLAGKIIELSKNEDLCMAMGKASMDRARERHNPDNIVKDLMFCYKSIVKDINNKVGNEQ